MSGQANRVELEARAALEVIRDVANVLSIYRANETVVSGDSLEAIQERLRAAHRALYALEQHSIKARRRISRILDCSEWSDGAGDPEHKHDLTLALDHLDAALGRPIVGKARQAARPNVPAADRRVAEREDEPA